MLGDEPHERWSGRSSSAAKNELAANRISLARLSSRFPRAISLILCDVGHATGTTASHIRSYSARIGASESLGTVARSSRTAIDLNRE